MPGLRQREQSLQGELQALRDRTAEEAAMLRLSETLASFLKRLHETAEGLDIVGRQKILRLLVKEVLVDKDSITIRHSIPIPRDPDDLGKTEDATLDRSSPASSSYLLRSGNDPGALRGRTGPVMVLGQCMMARYVGNMMITT
jgi:site-specific DNA recombinase